MNTQEQLIIPLNHKQPLTITPNQRLNRFIVYYVASLVKLLTAIFFIDRIDGPVFTQTTKDILINHTNIYYEATIHYKFNYFPLVYLIYLPFMAFYYYLWPLKIPVFERIFLKLPLIMGELLLAYLFREKENNEISTLELFILFNPFILYAGSYKSQFDVIPGIMMLLSWRKKTEEKPYLSGLYSGAAMMMKQYSLIFSFYLWLHYVKNNKKKAFYHSLGILTVFIPVLGVGALLNFKGLLSHAVLFHLGRNPNGYSITVITYYTIIVLLSFLNFPGSVITLIGNIILLLASIILLYLLIKISKRVWKTPENGYPILLHHILTAFLVFFLLNKGFLFHYLAAFSALVTEYCRITGRKPSFKLILWEIAFIPIIYALRVNLMVPIDIKLFIGEYWFPVLWGTLVSLHFIIVTSVSILKGKNYLFFNKKITRGYFVFVILLPLHYYGLYLILKYQLYTP